MKRKNKTIFKVTNDKRNKNEVLDLNDFKVTISEGVSGPEMAYALVILLSVVLEHENADKLNFTIDSFLHYLGLLMKDMQIGVPKGDSEDA